MNTSKFPIQPHKLPAVIYTTESGYQGVVPIRNWTTRDSLIESYRNSPGVTRIEEAMEQQPGWRTPNAMDLGTGNNAFERRAYLGTGNVIADTMVGFFVRPRTEMSCNGKQFDKGRLQSFDLEHFVSADLHAEAMTRFLLNDPRFETERAKAYVIFHFTRNKRVVHGALVTDPCDRLIRLFRRDELGLPTSASSAAVMATARHFLTDERISDRKTVWTLH